MFDIAPLEPYNRHRNLVPVDFETPTVSDKSFISPNCTLYGNCFVEDNASVWYGSTLDGFHRPIYLGKQVSVGTKSTLRNGTWIDEGICDSIVIGDNSIVGDNCLLVSCAIDENVKLGNNCTVLEGAKIERDSILDNNSLLSSARVIPSGQLWAGSPATFVRDLTAEEIQGIRDESDQIYNDSLRHKGLYE